MMETFLLFNQDLSGSLIKPCGLTSLMCVFSSSMTGATAGSCASQVRTFRWENVSKIGAQVTLSAVSSFFRPANKPSKFLLDGIFESEMHWLPHLRFLNWRRYDINQSKKTCMNLHQEHMPSRCEDCLFPCQPKVHGSPIPSGQKRLLLSVADIIGRCDLGIFQIFMGGCSMFFGILSQDYVGRQLSYFLTQV